MGDRDVLVERIRDALAMADGVDPAGGPDRIRVFLDELRQVLRGEATVQSRAEWASEARYYDGTRKHLICGDEEHARMVVRSTTEYLSSLNGPTRRAGGVERVVLVHRRVRTLPDGTQIVGPWREAVVEHADLGGAAEDECADAGSGRAAGCDGQMGVWTGPLYGITVAVCELHGGHRIRNQGGTWAADM